MTISGASDKTPFSVNCIALGLTVGSKYWIDVGLAAIVSRTTKIRRS